MECRTSADVKISDLLKIGFGDVTYHMMDSRTQANSRWVDQRRVEQAAVGSPTRGAAEGGLGVVVARGTERNWSRFITI